MFSLRAVFLLFCFIPTKGWIWCQGQERREVATGTEYVHGSVTNYIYISEHSYIHIYINVRARVHVFLQLEFWHIWFMANARRVCASFNRFFLLILLPVSLPNPIRSTPGAKLLAFCNEFPVYLPSQRYIALVLDFEFFNCWWRTWLFFIFLLIISFSSNVLLRLMQRNYHSSRLRMDKNMTKKILFISILFKKTH